MNCSHSATDDFNHGVVLSSRPLRSNEVFQVRIDKMVDKWAGSIEIGVTTHNPAHLQLPSTMTNLRSGNIQSAFVPDERWMMIKVTQLDVSLRVATATHSIFTALLLFLRHVDDDG